MLEYSTFGRHCAVDAWGIDFDLIDKADFLRDHMVKAAEKSGATVLSVQAQQFEPQGATVLVLLSESHLSIHTYPEKGFAAMDCYTCGDTVDPEVAINYLLEVLKPGTVYPKLLKRGEGQIEVLK